MLKNLFGNSLVFRLWILLSLVGTLFGCTAFAVYVLMSVNDDVQTAHDDTVSKADVIVSSLSRLSREGVTAATADSTIGRSLGMRSVEFINSQGQFYGQTIKDPIVPAQPAAEADVVKAALAGTRTQHQVVLKGNTYQATRLTPVDIIRGGAFAEEFVVPLKLPDSPNAAAVRFVIEYPALTSEARTLIGRVAWLGTVIIAVSLIGIWLFLRQFVSKPLKRYSQLAVRIAGGDSVRMPATGGGELAELGRALNGMADALSHQATVDQLTGLYNLRHLSSNLESLIEEAKRDNLPLSLIVGDLDNLKPVNDTFGHGAGDRLLQAVSDTLRSWSGTQFTCWRLGGDEFVVALPRMNGEEALAQAADLRGRIAAIQLPAGSNQVRASISVGVATYPTDGDSAGSLLNAADRRMYALKALRAEERRIATAHAAAA